MITSIKYLVMLNMLFAFNSKYLMYINTDKNYQV